MIHHHRPEKQSVFSSPDHGRRNLSVQKGEIECTEPGILLHTETCFFHSRERGVYPLTIQQASVIDRSIKDIYQTMFFTAYCYASFGQILALWGSGEEKVDKSWVVEVVPHTITRLLEYLLCLGLTFSTSSSMQLHYSVPEIPRNSVSLRYDLRET